MSSRMLFKLVGAFCLGGGLLGTVSAPRAEDAPADSPLAADVQARGPVHEAYAEPAETRPEPGPVIPKQPPDPVQEAAPDQKPEGDDVVWVPGYWAWDDEATDFTWVSGFWRTPPPGRVWTPGHWQEVEGGWQWVPGFWAAEDVQEVEYLPAPPPSIDNGPSTPAPDDTSVYVPGCWVYRETRYLWRPGYWVENHPDWCWIPDHYCWTPTGCVFVAGYWDYPLESRGLLFAPVRFRRDVLVREDFVYVPEYVVQPDFLLTALFVRPAYRSYYFGDYFEDRYEKHGFTPWVDYRVGRHALDPNFAFYRRRYRDEDRWESTLRDLYALRRSGDVPRPPRTWVQQTQVVNRITNENVRVTKNINITNAQNVTALAPVQKTKAVRLTGLAGLTGAADAPARAARTITLEAVPKQQQAEVKRHVEALRSVAATQQKEQAKLLSSGSAPVKPTDPPKAVRVDLPKPVARPQEPNARPRTPAAPPPPPPAPKHEERPIPPHEPTPASRPPRNVTAPTVKEPTPTPREPMTPKEPPAAPTQRDPATPPVKEPAPRDPTPTHREPQTPQPREPMQPPKTVAPPTVKEPPPPPKEPPQPPKEPTIRRDPPPAPPVREPAPTPRETPPPQPREPAPPTVKEPPQPTKEPTIRRDPPPAPPREPSPPPAHEPPTKTAPPPTRTPPTPPPPQPKDKPPAAPGR